MKILIVKLGAMGDVLRTTPLLTAYKAKYPECAIDWVVDKACIGVLGRNPLIDRLIEYSPEIARDLSGERYDLAINLDKEPEALNALDCAVCSEKVGFGWNDARTELRAMNDASEYAVRLGEDDELKFKRNQKTYQQISFEQAGLTFEGEEYVFEVDHADQATAEVFWKSLGFGAADAGRVVGINTGSGERFAGKRLSEENIVKLARLLYERTGRRVLLLGGPCEVERNERLAAKAGESVADGGTQHTIGVFAALVSRLGLVVTGDTIAMHIAIAVRVPQVVFFGSTCAAEIELYGRGAKIVSGEPCAPCYKGACPYHEKCTMDLSPETVLSHAESLLSHESKSCISG